MGPPGAPQAPYPGKQYLIGGNWKCHAVGRRGDADTGT